MSRANEPERKPEQQPGPEERPIEELFLLHLRYKEARLVEIGGNEPILLRDHNVSWIVYKGWADVFAVRLQNGKVAGSRRHLFRVQAGSAMLGMDLPADPNGVGLLVVSGNQTRLLQLNTERLQALAGDAEFGAQVTTLLDDWVRALSGALLSALPPKECVRLERGAGIPLPKDGSACARRGVLWVRHDEGHSRFAGMAHKPALNGKARWPISERSWIQMSEDSRLDIVDTASLIQQTLLWRDLQAFHQQILGTVADWMEASAEAEAARLQARREVDIEVVDAALARLATPLQAAVAAPAGPEAEAALLAACRLLGKRLGIEIVEPARTVREDGVLTLYDVARASHFQTRQVVLRDNWWRHDNGPLLAYKAENRQPAGPVAIWFEKGRTRLYDPELRQQLVVSEEMANGLFPFAHMFYRPLLAQQVSAFELLRFGLKQTGGDLRTILLTGSAIGLLGMVIPIATGLIFDAIIPNAARPQLLQVALALVVVAVAIALFQIMQNLAMLRLQGSVGANMQAAVWHRLLNLPVSFFRDYSAGDLGNRVMGITIIQQRLSGMVLNTLLAGVFSIFSLLLLFHYHSGLALVALALVAVSFTVTVVTGYRQLHHRRGLIDSDGRLSSIMLQTIEGISRFRASGAEGRAFAAWAREFSRAKQINYRVRDLANSLTVFNAGYQVLTTAIIFAMLLISGQQTMSTGQFLAFNAAFVQFMMAVLTVSGAWLTILSTVPLYERFRAVLQTAPEVDRLKEHPGELKGGLEVAHLSFRYAEEGPLVLQDVSLTVKPGEFVALVGPSGSGKSTLLRMLLGFEQPLSGAIYYDGNDLSGLDVREVRRQAGVVLQNGKIMEGDIFTNIVGASPMMLDDAWEAAAMAGLADDIKAMPMGMHTVLSAGGGTLSGGQRQRLLIARAIINRPRMLFFDEATSALDSHTQAAVSDSLDNLQATRIVIAHRLSTIMNADCIYVLDQGQIVQSGSYQQLMEEDGLFADLARRQTA